MFAINSWHLKSKLKEKYEDWLYLEHYGRELKIGIQLMQDVIHRDIRKKCRLSMEVLISEKFKQIKKL